MAEHDPKADRARRKAVRKTAAPKSSPSRRRSKPSKTTRNR